MVFQEVNIEPALGGDEQWAGWSPLVLIQVGEFDHVEFGLLGSSGPHPIWTIVSTTRSHAIVSGSNADCPWWVEAEDLRFGVDDPLGEVSRAQCALLQRNAVGGHGTRLAHDIKGCCCSLRTGAGRWYACHRTLVA